MPGARQVLPSLLCLRPAPRHPLRIGAVANMSLNAYLNKKVCIITTDGRTLVGVLASYDNTTNLVLQGTVERVIRPADEGEPSTEVPLGLYLIRGENVCVVGQVDEALDTSINWTEVKGAVIGSTKH